MLFDVLNEVFNSKRYGCDHLWELNQEVIVKSGLIALADTITDPWTVMIMRCYTLITWLAVLCPQRLLQVTHCTIFHFHEHNKLFVIRRVILCVSIFSSSFVNRFHFYSLRRCNTLILLTMELGVNAGLVAKSGGVNRVSNLGSPLYSRLQITCNIFVVYLEGWHCVAWCYSHHHGCWRTLCSQLYCSLIRRSLCGLWMTRERIFVILLIFLFCFCRCSNLRLYGLINSISLINIVASTVSSSTRFFIPVKLIIWHRAGQIVTRQGWPDSSSVLFVV